MTMKNTENDKSLGPQAVRCSGLGRWEVFSISDMARMFCGKVGHEGAHLVAVEPLRIAILVSYQRQYPGHLALQEHPALGPFKMNLSGAGIGNTAAHIPKPNKLLGHMLN